jgi:hypothetical protein
MGHCVLGGSLVPGGAGTLNVGLSTGGSRWWRRLAGCPIRGPRAG